MTDPTAALDPEVAVSLRSMALTITHVWVDSVLQQTEKLGGSVELGPRGRVVVVGPAVACAYFAVCAALIRGLRYSVRERLRGLHGRISAARRRLQDARLLQAGGNHQAAAQSAREALRVLRPVSKSDSIAAAQRDLARQIIGAARARP